jgi:hypothetical protein
MSDPYGRSLTAFGWINLPSYLHLYNMKSKNRFQPNPKISSKNRLKITARWTKNRPGMVPVSSKNTTRYS